MICKDQRSRQLQFWRLEPKCKYMAKQALVATTLIREIAGGIGSRLTQPKLHLATFCEQRERWHVISRKFQKKKLKKRLLSIWFGKYLNNYPPQGRWRVVDIYLVTSRLGIYPPLITSPSGDSCILFTKLQYSGLKIATNTVAFFPFATKISGEVTNLGLIFPLLFRNKKVTNLLLL